LIKTRDAGPTLYDWLRMPVRSGNQTFAHALVFPENYLLMAQSLLRALEAIHTNKYVHCDLHAGNISIPAEILQAPADGKAADVSSLSFQLSFSNLTLIDFGFSINCQKKPYTTLPFAQEGYRARISPHLKSVLSAIKEQTAGRLEAGQHWEDVWLDAGFWQRLDGASPLDSIRTIDWREDMFQLGHLLADIRDGSGDARHLGGRTVRDARQTSINALIAELPEQLMRWGDGVGTPAPQEKPHQEYINRIDAALTQARNHGDVATTSFVTDAKEFRAAQMPHQQNESPINGKVAAGLHAPETQLKQNPQQGRENITANGEESGISSMHGKSSTHGSASNDRVRGTNKTLPINLIWIAIGIAVLAAFGYPYIKDTDMMAEIHHTEMAKIEVEPKRIAIDEAGQNQAEIERLAVAAAQAKKEREEPLRREIENKSRVFVERNGSNILNSAYPLAFNRLAYQSSEAQRVIKSDGGYTATVRLNYLNLLGASHYLDIAFNYDESGEYIAWNIVDFSDIIAPHKLTLGYLL